MTFPQTSASLYVTGNESLWRLKTPLASPGDLYESEVSSLAFMIGPESDIANVTVVYFNAQNPPSQTSTLSVSPDKAFVGLVSARNDTGYPLAKEGAGAAPARKGRILIYPQDIYNPSYVPSTAAPGDVTSFEVPILDVIQYFTEPPSIIAPRADKTWNYNFYDVIGNTQFIVIPYYGRKFAYLEFTNRMGPGAMDFGITAINYSLTTDETQEKVILAPFAVALNATKDQIIRASVNGMFDALVVSIAGGVGPAPLKIVMSDDAL